MKYGFFSAQHCLISKKEITGNNPISIYSTTDEKKVAVTCVTESKDGGGYNWPDKQFVGEVIRWLRKGV